jgi:2-polyprenyl-3-methyl-5-hydroxy-6-metoxy-1,4-benzoquinol methylase
MQRVVKTEMLDHLPVNDPLAVGSRRDLRLINRLMGHKEILAKVIRRGLGGKRSFRLLDIGAGDGLFGLRVLRTLGCVQTPCHVTFVDRLSAISKSHLITMESLGWNHTIVERDIFEWLEDDDSHFDVCFANLFLHHFQDDRLSEMLGLIRSRCDFFACTEPRRSAMGLMGVFCLPLLGCNRVTRNDARLSVHAGFRASELSSLCRDDMGWELTERPAGLFSHLFTASRVSHHEQ